MKKKVLHLRTSAGFWGPERQISQLIEPMRRHGFEIEVLVLYRHRPELPVTHPLVAAVRQKHGRATQLADRWRDLPLTFSSVTEELESKDFTLLHTHEYKSDIIGGMAAKLAGIPAVASVRGYTDRTLPLRLYKHIDLFALRWFDRVLPVSNHMRDQLLEAGLSGQRVVTMYDAIDPQSFGAGWDSDLVRLRQRLGLDGAPKVVSIVGRLSPEKGHRYFLESAAQILERFSETRFLITGDGPERHNLESLAANLGVDHTVFFLGYRRDVSTIMGTSDVVVLSSEREGFGDVLIEAMSLAKPVVATAVGGVPEIVRHEETGLLVPAGDSAAMAQAVARLLNDPVWAGWLGAQGHEVVTQHFHVDILAQKLALVYQELLECSARQIS